MPATNARIVFPQDFDGGGATIVHADSFPVWGTCDADFTDLQVRLRVPDGAVRKGQPIVAKPPQAGQPRIWVAWFASVPNGEDLVVEVHEGQGGILDHRDKIKIHNAASKGPSINYPNNNDNVPLIFISWGSINPVANIDGNQSTMVGTNGPQETVKGTVLSQPNSMMTSGYWVVQFQVSGGANNPYTLTITDVNGGFDKRTGIHAG